MAATALKNCKLWMSGYDLSGESNALSYDETYDELEVPAFGYGAKRRIAGLPKVTLTHEGWAWSDGSTGPDDVLTSLRGVFNTPATIAPLTGAAGEAAYFSTVTLLKLGHGGATGDPYSFQVEAGGSQYPLVRGTIMEYSAKTATGDGTVRELGEVVSGTSLYASLHILAVSGTNPTLDLLLKSAVTNWATVTTRVTFAQAVAKGAQFATPVAGPITDTFWRASYTIGGTDTPSFTIALVVGTK